MPYIGDELSELDWVANAAQEPYSNNYRRYCDWYQWHQDAKSMDSEMRRITSVKSKLGWTRCKLFRRCASMPLHVFAILRRIEPEFATNTQDGRKLFYRFLQRRPEFSVSWDR